MNSKERLLTALKHEEPDGVPIDLWFFGGIEAMLSLIHGGLRVAMGHDLVMSSSPNIGASYEIPRHTGIIIKSMGHAAEIAYQRCRGPDTETISHPPRRRSCPKRQLVVACRICKYRVKEVMKPDRLTVFSIQQGQCARWKTCMYTA